MKTLSNSEIESWRRCRRAWSFTYEYQIQKPEKSIPLASGSAVHETIQAILDGKIPFAAGVGYVEDRLTQILIHREDFREQVNKFLPGAVRALNKVPEWVWEEKGWHVEDAREVLIAPDVTLRFTPDLWKFTEESWTNPIDGEVSTITWLDIYDFKTGKKDPIEYYLNSPQLSYYAVALHKLYPDTHPRISYIGLPTADKVKPVVDVWAMTDEQMAEAEQELIAGIQEVGVGERWPSRSTLCGYCDFNAICTTRFLGGDWMNVIKEDFVKYNPYQRYVEDD